MMMDADLRVLCIVFRTISRKVRLQKVNRTTMVGAQPRHSYTIKIDSFTMLHITLVFITNDDFDVHHQFRSVEFPHGWVVKSAHTRLINEKNLIVLMLYILVFITNIDLICYPRIYKLMLSSYNSIYSSTPSFALRRLRSKFRVWRWLFN